MTSEDESIKWGMIIPFFYSIYILWAILDAIRFKFKQENLGGIPVSKWEALGVYCAVLPWVLMTVFCYFHISQWIEVLFTNVGFIFITAVFISHNVRRQRHLFAQLKAQGELPSAVDCFEENLSKYAFSAREKDIIRLIRSGLKRQLIAERLFIAPTTVSRHLQNIFYKAEVNNRLELVLKLEKKDCIYN